MFEALGQRFTTLFSGLRGKVSQSQLNDFAADIYFEQSRQQHP